MREAEARRIVVVDDDVCIADSLAIIFCNAGYDAVATYDGQAALERCMERAPDLLLSDVMMPGMDGIELGIVVKKQYPGCKVLLISGTGSAFILLERAERRGFHFEMLEKPMPPAELLEKVAALLARDAVLPFPARAVAIRRDPSGMRRG